MGVPIKLILDGKPVFVCCPACEKPANELPIKLIKRMGNFTTAVIFSIFLSGSFK